jgi:hypothetical protein
MAFSTRQTIGAVFGAACLTAIAAPVSAGMLSVAPLKDVGLTAPITDVATRTRHVSTRHVTVRRHHVGRRYVGHRRYYYRRHYGSAYPAAALGLFAGVLGAAVASSYDDCYYGYGYGYGCGYYPSYSYGYGYPYSYSYGYARPRYYYGGRRFHNGGNFVGHHFNGPRMGGFRGGMVGRPGGGGGMMRVGGGGGGRGGWGGRGGGGHR